MRDDLFKSMDAQDVRQQQKRAVEPDQHGNRSQRRLWRRLYGTSAVPPTPAEVDGSAPNE